MPIRQYSQRNIVNYIQWGVACTPTKDKSSCCGLACTYNGVLCNHCKECWRDADRAAFVETIGAGFPSLPSRKQAGNKVKQETWWLRALDTWPPRVRSQTKIGFFFFLGHGGGGRRGEGRWFEFRPLSLLTKVMTRLNYAIELPRLNPDIQ